MVPYDGVFALNIIYPLAVTAYSDAFTPPNTPNPADYTDAEEILVDLDDSDFKKLLARVAPPKHPDIALTKMRKPAPTAAAPTPASAPLDAPAPTPVDDRFGWVCRQEITEGNPPDKEFRLVVTFRGTQTAEDWLENLDFIAVPYQPIPGRGTVHQGFQLAYYAIRANLLDLVQKLGQGCTELLVVGHSLGGALATLAMPDLLNVLDNPNLSPILYNLASPRVGHGDFQSFFDSHVNVCYRVVNQWDVVPHLPPDLAGYVHVGSQVAIDSGFHLDVAENHVLETGYLPGLEAWVQHHPTTQTPKLGCIAIAPLVGVSA